MSQFKCEVVPVVLEPHPNADTLSLVKVWGYTVVVKTEEWIGRDRGVYIPPDSVVPCGERFAFLFKDPQQSARVTARRFRKVWSEGLLMPTDGPDFEIGGDMTEAWGITHYEPPITYRTQGSEKHPQYDVPGPPGLVVPKYDVENFKRYGDCLPEGTLVYVTEKIHGCNARYCFDGDKMYVGSRSNWKHDGAEVWLYHCPQCNKRGSSRRTEDDGYALCDCGADGDPWTLWCDKYEPTDPWWNCLLQNPWIEEWCRAHPGMVLYGEVFGQVQDLKYGTKNGELRFLAFDVLDRGRWVNYAELEGLVPADRRAPVVFLGPFDEALVREIADRDSVICPGQMAEGVVICPLMEMTHHAIGRVQLKIISNRYLEKSK